MAGERSCSGSFKTFDNYKLAVPTSAILYHFGTSAVSVATATGVTHPLDVLKVRLQMQLIGKRGPLTGVGKVFTQMLQKEGPRSFYLGLGPALTRSFLYGGLRLGLYEPTKYAWEIGFGSSNILLKLASGAIAGSFATALTNPVEVLKVRTQMSSDSRGGAIREMRKIASEEGIRALWKGVGPAMARAAALTASQLATYDESKQILLRWTPFQEGFQLHFISSTIAGLVSTLITAPMDMVKTRLMLQRESGKLGTYKNGFHCAYKDLYPDHKLCGFLCIVFSSPPEFRSGSKSLEFGTRCELFSNGFPLAFDLNLALFSPARELQPEPSGNW